MFHKGCSSLDLFGESPEPDGTEYIIEYFSDERDHEVDARLSPCVEDGSSSLVDSDVTTVNDMKCSCSPKCKDSECSEA